jgi:hypothetical protein
MDSRKCVFLTLNFKKNTNTWENINVSFASSMYKARKFTQSMAKNITSDINVRHTYTHLWQRQMHYTKNSAGSGTPVTTWMAKQ